MQNDLKYSQLAHNDMKLDNVLQNETILVTDQSSWGVWQLTGRDGHLFSQLMKNNFTNAYTDRVRMMEFGKLIRTQQNSNVGLTVYLAKYSSSHRNATSSLQNSRKMDFEIGKV